MKSTGYLLVRVAALIGAGLASAQSIVCPPDSSGHTRLAAQEVRRYVYLRTGKLLPIAETGAGILLATDPGLAKEQYRLRTSAGSLTISGGSDLAVLYGAYAFAEKLGVRFYLHGDLIPEPKVAFNLPQLDETHAPLFETRGIQPFHDFPEGPDWWNEDDYLAYLHQLVRLRMNFIGLHCYPEGGVGPEPLVWIGVTNDLAADGRVRFSYPSAWANTAKGTWGYASMKTSEFAGGAHLLFPSDDYGPEVMAGLLPRPASLEQSNELFDRVGRQFGRVFAEARRLGIQTCVGTESPLTIPRALRERLQSRGLDPTAPHTVLALYTGMFARLARVSPVDFYWLWTPEDWTWGGNQPGQLEATLRDIRLALTALEDLGNPFVLATSGWVLGPAQDRAALDAFLPKTSPMSCINRQVGHEGVEPAFARIDGRPKWAIPWMENDPNLVGAQPWVARMRHDAADARRFGCTGLLGIHWRSKALAPNVAALAAAAWDQPWLPAGFDLRPPQVLPFKEGALGGQVAAFSALVADTPLPAIYQTVRYGLDGYHLVVPNGMYTVTLQFNEPHYTAPGRRVFGAAIQGRQVITNLDVYARVGPNRALDLAFPQVAVTHGVLRIGFTPEVEFPCVAGLVVEGTTDANHQPPHERLVRKINCGGGPVRDYEADRTGGDALTPSPRDRAMPIEDFYLDFARAHFGDTAGEAVGRLFAKMDGVRMPQASDWKNGPGNLVANPRPWSEVESRYEFVDELASRRARIVGAGNLERFDYWLNTWRAMRGMAEACCLRGELDRAMAAQDYEKALTHRVDLARAWSRLLTLQVATVDTPGELGTIANLEQHTRKESHFLDEHDVALAAGLGRPLPAETSPAQTYSGPARLIVPTVRSLVSPGEVLTLRIIAIAPQPITSVSVKVRLLGTGEWQTLAATHVGRAVFQVQFPAASADFEYYLVAGEDLVWPASAPEFTQTVVVMPGSD